MKKILLTLVLLVGMVFGLFAQQLTYQAVIRDNNQQLVVNTPMKATVTITFETGNPYTETVNATTNIHGLLTFEFGDASLNGLDWTDATIAVKVVNANDESVVYVNDAPHSVSAVPYALSVNGQSIQNYLNEHHYVTQTQVGRQIQDSIANIGGMSPTQDHSHSNMDVLNATTASFTTAKQTTLDSLVAIGAQKNVQSDWTETDDTKDAYIQNKPTNVSAFTNDAGYVTDANVTALLQNLSDQVAAQNAKMDSLAHLVDSLSRLPHGGGDTPTEVADGQPCPNTPTVSYYDVTYNTVGIGTQCWMKENLRTTKYANGDTIASVKMFNPKGNADNVTTCGLLYTWSAATRDSSTTYPAVGQVKVQGICPNGWHVPSDAEWTALTTYVKSKAEYRCNNDNNAIGKVLASSTGWSSNSTNCAVGNSQNNNNLTGFSAFPAGGKYRNDLTSTFGNYAYFWSASQNDTMANYWYLYYRYNYIKKYKEVKTNAYSVRCLRDAGIDGTQVNDDIGTNPIVVPGGDNTCCSELSARLDSLKNVIDSLTNLTLGGGNTSTESVCPATVSDGSNIYNTVKIGNQCWMKENLRTNNVNGFGSVYTNSASGDNVTTYGLLYNWAAVMQNETPTAENPNVRGICPEGWHVPSEDEWSILFNNVQKHLRRLRKWPD